MLFMILMWQQLPLWLCWCCDCKCCWPV